MSRRVKFLPTREKVRGLEILVARDFAAVRRAALQFSAFLAANHCREDEIWGCELAFVEACNNAVQHGPHGKQEHFRVTVSLSAAEVEIRINGDGPEFELPAEAELPPDSEESGRGLYLIRSIMDQVRCERADAVNCLVLRKQLTGI